MLVTLVFFVTSVFEMQGKLIGEWEKKKLFFSFYVLSVYGTISYLESSSLTAHAGLTRLAVSQPLVKGNEDAEYEGVYGIEATVLKQFII